MTRDASILPPRIEITSAPVKNGVAVLVNGRPARTPRGNPLLLPTWALARAVVEELAADPGRLAGKGLNDPACAPNFRLAHGAIDVISLPEGRKQVEDEVAAYAGTDLVCYRAARPRALVERQDALWAPLLDRLAERHGARLAVTDGIVPVAHDPEALAAVRVAIAARDSMRLAALSHATRSAGSVVIGLALMDGDIDVEWAYEAAVLDEAFQAAQWGEDSDAAARRASLRLDLEHAVRFIDLLSDVTGQDNDG